MILMLAVVVAGWFATDYLDNKARQEIIRESHASVFTLSLYVSYTINVIENAVKTLAASPWIAPALLSKGEQDIEHANSTLDRYDTAFFSISKKYFCSSACFGISLPRNILTFFALVGEILTFLTR